MKYRLVIADKYENEIKEYRNVELISKSKSMDMVRMRFDCDPEYSRDPEHPNYIEFSVFRDRTVNVHEFDWVFEDDIFLAHYDECGFATYKVLTLEQEIEEVEDDGEYEWDYSQMKACDISGICAGPSCSQYYQCQA